MTESELIERGAQARELLAHPLFREAKDAVSALIYRDWAKAKTPAEREEIHAQLAAGGRFIGYFEAVMTRGAEALAKQEHRASEAAREAEFEREVATERPGV